MVVNGYMPLIAIIGVVFMAAFLYVPFVLLFIGLIGVMVTITTYMAITKMAPRLYPIRIRVLEKRGNGFKVIKTTSAKEVMDKKGRFWYETIGGKRMKRGDNDDELKTPGQNNTDYIDFLRLGADDYYPLSRDMTNGGEIKIIDEDRREWLANKIIEANEATKPPLSNLEKLLPFVQWIAVGMFVFISVLGLTMFMNEYPKWQEYNQAQMQTLDGQIKVMDAMLTKMCEKYGINCANAPTQPPGQNYTVTTGA